MRFFLWSYYYALRQFGSNWRHAQLLICPINCKFGARISRLLSGVQNVQALFVIAEQRSLDMVCASWGIFQRKMRITNCWSAQLESSHRRWQCNCAMLIDDSEVAQIHSCWVPLLCVNSVYCSWVDLPMRWRSPGAGYRWPFSAITLLLLLLQCCAGIVWKKVLLVLLCYSFLCYILGYYAFAMPSFFGHLLC